MSCVLLPVLQAVEDVGVDALCAGMELRNSGVALQALPQKRYGALEVRCRRADVDIFEVWKSGDVVQA